MYDLSKEQNDIVDFMSTGNSTKCCIVNAFAGSGKTLTIERVAETRYQKGLGWTLLVTYSSQLKKDTREQTKNQDGIKVESMHSLVRNILYPGHDCLTDDDILAYLNLETKPFPHKNFLSHITLIAVDEMQDLSPLYFRLIQQLRWFFVCENKYAPTSLLGTGDIFQWIFHSLNGSLTDYMCRPEEFFEADTFVFLPLTYSFRLTAQTCKWINACLNPHSIKVHYPVCWAKYGEFIERYWGTGLRSAKCAKCGTIHFKTPNSCPRICSKNILQLQEVSCCDVDSYKELLTPTLSKRAKQNAATVIVNGLRVDRFRRQFPSATSASSLKGCEVRNCIVVGFDSFTEEVFATSPHAQPEDWPFECFCQMYVSCSRPRNKLFVQKAKSKPCFFTMRDYPIDVVGTAASLKTTVKLESKRREQIRSSNKLFEFVPSGSDVDVDEYLVTKNIIEQKLPILYDAPDYAPGLTPKTLIRNFKSNYHDAIIKAIHLDQMEGKVITNWTNFMREIILSNKGDTVNKSWTAKHNWCEAVIQRSLVMLKKSGLKIYGACCSETIFMRLRSKLHFTARWAGAIQVVFSNNVSKLHEAMITYLSFKQQHPQVLLMNCYVLKPLTNELLLLTLNVHPDFYFGEIVRRKQWDFLLSPSFTLIGLSERGISIPVKRLNNEDQASNANKKVKV